MEIDVHDSLQSTLRILGHKLRLKQIEVEKRFAASFSVPLALHRNIVSLRTAVQRWSFPVVTGWRCATSGDRNCHSHR